MPKRIVGALNYANVMATLALVVALGGTSYAAATLGKNSVKSKNIANNAVTTKKLKNGAVTTKKLKNGAVTASKLAGGAVGASAVKAGSLQASDFAAGQLPAANDPGPPIGPAGGDLTGQYPNPQVNVTLPAPAALTPGTNWSLTTTDGQPPLSCYEDREGIVHFVGGIHSSAGAMPIMATLPAQCPPPPSNIVVQALGNLVAPADNFQTAPYVIPVTIHTDATLTNTSGTAGGTSPNMSLDSITYRAR